MSKSNNGDNNIISAPPNHVYRFQHDGDQPMNVDANPATAPHGAVSVYSVTQGSISRLHAAPSVHSLAAPLSPGSGSAGSGPSLAGYAGGNTVHTASPHNSSSFQFSETSPPPHSVSLAAIAPETIAAKLNMGTLSRQIRQDECRDKQRAQRKRWTVYGAVGLILALGIGIVVGYFVFQRTSSGGTTANGPNGPSGGATEAPSVPRRLRDKPVPMVVPSSASDTVQQRTFGSASASDLVSNWATVLPSADLSISQSTADPLVRARLAALSGAYRPRLFPYSDCGLSPPTLDAPTVSSIVLSVNASLLASAGPDAYQLVVTTRSVSLTAASPEGIARGFESLVTSMVAGGAPCAYRLPVMDSGLQRPAALIASGLRGVWADVRNMSSSISGITGKSLSRVVEVAAAAKLNSLILRLPSDFAQDAIPTPSRRTPVLPATAQASNDSTATLLAEVIATSTSRLVSLLPEIDFSTSAMYSPSLSICPEYCPSGPNSCGGLNLHMQAARDAQFAWWSDVKTRMGGKVKAVMVGSLFSPAYIECLRRTGGSGQQLPVEVIRHWNKMFDDGTIYHPATHIPVQGLANVKTVPVVAPGSGTPVSSPSLAVDVPAGMSGAVVYLRNLVPAGTSVETVAPMAVTVRGGGSGGSAVGGGLLVDLPSQYLTEQRGMNEWLYMVAAKAWANGWVGSGVDAARLRKEVDGFKEWVAGDAN